MEGGKVRQAPPLPVQDLRTRAAPGGASPPRLTPQLSPPPSHLLPTFLLLAFFALTRRQPLQRCHSHSQQAPPPVQRPAPPLAFTSSPFNVLSWTDCTAGSRFLLSYSDVTSQRSARFMRAERGEKRVERPRQTSAKHLAGPWHWAECPRIYRGGADQERTAPGVRS